MSDAPISPAAVVDWQATMLFFTETHDLYRKYIQGWFTSTRLTEHHKDLITDEYASSGEALRIREITRLRMALAYQISRDMVDVLRISQQQLPADMAMLDKEMLPSEYGFLWFDRSWVSTDINERPTTTRALTWGPASETIDSWMPGQPSKTRATTAPTKTRGVRINFYGDTDDPDDWYNTEYIGKYPEYRLIQKEMPRLQIDHSMYLPFNAQFYAADDAPPETFDKIKAKTSNSNLSRVFIALMLLMGQELTSLEEGYVPKTVAKRAMRAQIPGRVTVVTLRRRSSGHRNDDESLVEWRHRWMVRGHWAWRRCGPDLDGAIDYEGGHRRRVYISPYVKGPENAPLIGTEKVYRLSR
jgi:hypothetical protein